MARESERLQLVERVRESTAIGDPRIWAAFTAVPRHEFVPEERQAIAYEDWALPLDEEQAISQPSMIAIMLHELAAEPTHRALEVGAGSGYAAALLSQLVREVHAVEVRPGLLESARSNLQRAGIEGVHLVLGDGSYGLPEHAPYDRILVSAAAKEVPPELVEQLAVGGRLVIPVGDEHGQVLVIGEKTSNGELSFRRTGGCIFVPLVRG